MNSTLLYCFSFFSAASLLAACAGEETGTASGDSDATTSSATGAGGAGGSGGSATGGGGQGGSGQGGAGGAGGAGGGGGSSSGALVPVLKSLDMYIDCMPAVDPDPVQGSFVADYDNSAGSAPELATITSARLVFGNASGTFKFSVTPQSSGNVAPGVVLGTTHAKTSGSGSGDKPPCSFCNDVWSLEVTWDIGGAPVTKKLEAGPVLCVF